MRDSLKATGRLQIVVRRRDGTVKDRRVVENTVTTAGKNAVCALVVGVRTVPFQYVAIGTGTPTETALGNEVARVKAQVSAPSYAYWYAEIQATASWDVTEAGIFDSSSGGTMLCYASFSALHVEPGDTVQVTWTFTLT